MKPLTLFCFVVGIGAVGAAYQARDDEQVLEKRVAALEKKQLDTQDTLDRCVAVLSGTNAQDDVVRSLWMDAAATAPPRKHKP